MMNPPETTPRALACVLVFAALCAGLCRGAEGTSLTVTNVKQWLQAHRAGTPFVSDPVELRGVVTYQMPDRKRSFFLHDGSASVQAYAADVAPELLPGSVVEVSGIRRVNEYGPYIAEARVTKVGEGPLPEPEPADLQQLISGQGHGTWTELTGTVVDVMLNNSDPAVGQLWLLVTSGFAGANVVFMDSIDRLPEELINARVSIRGVCHTTLSTSGRPISCRIIAATGNAMRVLTAVSSNRFDRPLRTTRSLRGQSPAPDDRFLLRGVVTHASPTGWFVLEDESGAVQVERLTPMPTRSDRESHVPRMPLTQPQPGDVVEVVASHVKSRPLSPVVSWADCRVTGRRNLPAALQVTGASLNDPAHDCRRVRIRARVIEQSTPFEPPHHFAVLVLHDGKFRFDAVLGGPQQQKFPVQVNDFVEVTGVATSRSTPGASRIFLSSIGDVRVLPAPPIWLTGAAARIAAIAGAALALALGWIWALRRRVQSKTAELAATNERLRHNEAELKRALAHEQELNQLKANFVSMVSHEFRTPLGVIVSSADILRRYFDRLNSEMRKEQLDIVLRSTNTLSSLVEDLLLLGKAEAGKLACQPAPLEMVTLCRHLADEVASATRRACPIHLSTEGNFDGAIGDEGLLRPALVNLLMNAVKYSANGEPVDFLVARRDVEAEFVIRDHGIGIPEEDQQKLFTVFARGTNVGSRPGTGLGLVIARRCVELHGGRIEFKSRQSEGTTFTVHLPLFADLATARRHETSVLSK